jgi:NAD(P)H-hydrate epimerase
MKVLTAAQMRDIDRRTIDGGAPGIVLMENAALRVVETLASRFSPLSKHRIVVLCGKGNNGGDGLAIARQLLMRFTTPRSLSVVLAADPRDLVGDARLNLDMLTSFGIPIHRAIEPEMRRATLVIDALLGTGLEGPAHGEPLEFINEINAGFPDARVIAVDIPSGMPSDTADMEGVCARADLTVTFTAPKLAMALPPNCDRVGELIVAPVGSPPAFMEQDPRLYLSLVESSWFWPLFEPRARGAHKGDFGHVLIIGGSVGKSGAAAMSGLAALRSGAGLVTVASAESAIASIAAHAPELMSEPLAETVVGSISNAAAPRLDVLAAGKSVVAIGPGLGSHPETVTFAQTQWERSALPMIVDADGINALAGTYLHPGGPRVLTPHPGEMARFCGLTVPQVQADRIGVARSIALDREITLVLKGQRTVIAFPDGRVWINPTGTPALASGGSGDILTGFIAGLLAQFPEDADYAIAAAVWLHGRAGEMGAAEVGEKTLLATDLLRYLPAAMKELTR